MKNNDNSFEQFLEGLSEIVLNEELVKKADEKRKDMNDTLDSLKELADLFHSIGEMAEFLNECQKDEVKTEDKVDLSYLFEERTQDTLFDEETTETEPLTREEYVHRALTAYESLKEMIKYELNCELVTGYAGQSHTTVIAGTPVILQPLFANLIDITTKELVASTMIMEDSTLVGAHNRDVSRLFVALHLVEEIEELDFIEPHWESFFLAPEPTVSTSLLYNRMEDLEGKSLSEIPLHVYDDSFLY